MPVLGVGAVEGWFATLLGGGGLGIGGLVIFILRGMNGRIKGKVDQTAFDQREKHVDQKFESGKEQFTEIITTQKETTAALGELTTSVGILVDRGKRGREGDIE